MVNQCPTCDRKFEGIRDFPLVYVMEVSIIKPDQIPKAIPHWYTEDLLEKKSRDWNREIVPAEVLTHFKTHPDEDTLVHSDDFIYQRPYEDTKEFREVSGDGRQKQLKDPKFWKRRQNYAPAIKKIMEENQSVKQYFEGLEQVVGQEVPTSRLLPNWEQYGHLTLGLNESKQRTNEYRVSEINLFGDGPRGDGLRQILQVGQIKYEGRIHCR